MITDKEKIDPLESLNLKLTKEEDIVYFKQ